jgi:hypothetical protein
MDSASSQNTETLIQMSLLYDVSKIKNSVKIVWRKRLDVQSQSSVSSGTVTYLLDLLTDN